MDSYLAERLLGQGLAVTPVLLSRACQEPLGAAKAALKQFWFSRKDQLDASFVVTSSESGTIEVKILPAAKLEPLSADQADLHIYSVATASASDPAVLLQLGEETREIEATLPLETLKRLGVIINPFAKDISSSAPVTKPAVTKPSSLTKRAEVKTESIDAKRPSGDSTPTPKQTPSQKQNSEAKQELEPTKPKSNVKKASRASPFQSISKEQAMAKAFQSKPRKKIVSETVVGGDDLGNDSAMSDEGNAAEDSLPKENVDLQRQKLASLFDEPDLSEEPEDEEEDETAQYESETHEHEDLVLSDAPLPMSDDEDVPEKAASPVKDTNAIDTSESIDKEDQRDQDNAQGRDESSVSSRDPEVKNAGLQRPQTRKVKKIVSEVVDGWTTTKEIIVEEPIEGSNETTPVPEPPAAPSPKPKPVTPTASSTATPDKPKSGGSKKTGQRPLTSFFAKRK